MQDDSKHRILFSEQLPFNPLENQVIYVESEYTPEYNHYIQQNLGAIQEQFYKFGLEFCYLPTLAQNLNDAKIIQYRNPEILQYDRVLDMANFSQSFVPYVLDGHQIKPALISYLNRREYNGENGYLFSYCELELLTDAPFDKQLELYLSDLRQCDGVRFHCSQCVLPQDDYADATFNEETLQMMDEIRERVEQLRQRGIGELVLKQLLQPSNKISRLHITKDYRLFLLDYNNLEIKMTPLPKSVYILFLRHPEGILFKHLSDYYEELLQIYYEITHRFDDRKIKESIMALTDPTNNAINEKCARIREAFVQHFDDCLAKNYYITGERALPKGIALDHSLVDWEK